MTDDIEDTSAREDCECRGNSSAVLENCSWVLSLVVVKISWPASEDETDEPTDRICLESKSKRRDDWMWYYDGRFLVSGEATRRLDCSQRIALTVYYYRKNDDEEFLN